MFFLKDLPTRQMIEGYVTTLEAGDEDAIETALIMMRDASVLVRRIDQYFQAENLSQLRFLIMIVIDREPERPWLYQGEVAERLDVSKPVLTRAVQSLMDAGLLTVSPDEDDKRWKRLSLSPDGTKRLHALLPGYFQLISDFMADRKGG
ncbi:MAG: MarR family transcriptional regulator [Pseudomonadota bacterium]